MFQLHIPSLFKLRLQLLIVVAVCPFMAFAKGNDLCSRFFSGDNKVATVLTSSTSSNLRALKYADAMIIRLKDANYKEYDQNVLDVISKTEDLDFKDMRVGGELGNVISRSTIQELNLLAKDKNFAETFSERLFLNVSKDERLHQRFVRHTAKDLAHFINTQRIQSAAKSFLSYQYLTTIDPQQKGYTLKQFAEIAKIEGLEITQHGPLFRFDSREPSEIFNQKGFFPNPKTRKGTLTDHSAPGHGSFGTGFVSLSTVPGNEFNLKIGPGFMAGKPVVVNPNQIREMFKVSLGQLPKTIANGKFEILKTFEYEVESSHGVFPSKESQIAGEAEFVVPFASSTKISRYREIYLLVEIERSTQSIENIKMLSSYIGEWKSF